MHEIDQFLSRAVRGLWGRQRREVELELRGAIEDKLYRYRLLGYGPEQASQAALRDLGPPEALAREFRALHSWSHSAQLLLLLGLAGLLSLQAVAQTPAIQAAPRPIDQQSCDFSRANLNRIAQNAPTHLHVLWRSMKLLFNQGACRTRLTSTYDYLRVSDMISALEAGGLQVQTEAKRPGRWTLTFPDDMNPTTLNLSKGLKSLAGQWYVDQSEMLASLTSLNKPIHLKGTINPILFLGPASLPLGTQQTPVKVTDLYLTLVPNALEQLFKKGSPTWSTLSESSGRFVLYNSQFSEDGLALKVNLPDGIYVVVSNADFMPMITLKPSCHRALPECIAQRRQMYNVSVHVSKNGRFLSPLGPYVDQQGVQRFAKHPQGFASPEALVQATAQHRPGFLLYKLKAPDLRRMQLEAVPVSQVEVLE